jgi:hypothetical protein
VSCNFMNTIFYLVMILPVLSVRNQVPWFSFSSQVC